MKRLVFPLILLGLSTFAFSQNEHVISKTDNSVTFVVDENLPAPKRGYRKKCANEVAQSISSNIENTLDIRDHEIFASSFSKDSLYFYRNDVLYECVVEAYADHRSIMLSPDMIWLVISQGFARYVNAHSEQLRPMLVYHKGFDTLKVNTSTPLSEITDFDWMAVVDSFSVQIARKTKNGIAATMKCDFSTTKPAERIASEITLMKSTDDYFKYEVFYSSCGIPSITLKGTPEDWRRVLEKTRKLSEYGLENWVAVLEPILAEFVSASEGNPDQRFWRNIVKKRKTDELKYPGCRRSLLPQRLTKFDGWILSLFPNENGEIREWVYLLKNMPAEQLAVSFSYNVIDRSGKKLVVKPLEFVSGFVGFDIDSQGVIIPRIGWFIQDEKKEDKEQRLW